VKTQTQQLPELQVIAEEADFANNSLSLIRAESGINRSPSAGFTDGAHRE
jgi:hypothetical protein